MLNTKSVALYTLSLLRSNPNLNLMKFQFLHWTALLALTLCLGIASPSLADPGVFQTSVSQDLLDGQELVEWVDGEETSIKQDRGVSHLLASQTTATGFGGREFGNTRTPGPRYLRLSLKGPVAVGTMIVRGGVEPSVLISGQPGNLNDDAQWIAGQLNPGKIFTETRHHGFGREDYAVWTFPEGTQTTTIRFKHEAKATDKSYAGWIGGAYVLPQRFVNLAPPARSIATGQTQYSVRINDETLNDTWGAWSNGTEGSQLPISAERPEFVTLVWDEPVTIRGLCTLWTGFGAADALVYIGPEEKHPNESTEATDWKMVASRTELRNGYVPALLPEWFDFGETITTRAVRLKITGVTTEDHGHMTGHTKNGRRVWLGELMAFAPLAAGQDPIALIPKRQETDQPPIPIPFTLPEDSVVTLVIEKSDGTRVCNLLADTPFPKGKNTVYWDGSDDLLRDQEAARHGVYNIPKRLVEPGTYTVRGLYRKPLSLHYEFSVYNEGTPPWATADNTGGWLTNHTPPSCALWVPSEQSPTGSPLVYLGSYVSEGGHGLAWFEVQADAQRGVLATKKGGVGWVGGHWTGAQHLARDLGENRVQDHNMYAASVWGTGANNHDGTQDCEIRISALQPDKQFATVKYTFTPKTSGSGEHNWGPNLGGIAVHNGVAIISLSLLNKLVYLDVKDGKVLDTVSWENPGGVAFDKDGNFYLLSDNNLFRWTTGTKPRSGNRPFIEKLDEPKSLTFDDKGNIYISENGNSHHVRMFGQNGRPLRTIGKTGKPAAGPYDELRMNNPAGMTIDDAGRLWVTENDYQPKRVSVWSSSGQLIRAFYGPAKYGGGGKLDPKDPTRFYYHGMEFQLDWTVGTFKLVRILFRPETATLGMPDGWGTDGFPETPLYVNNRRYFTNSFNSNPTNGTPLACIWYDDPETGAARIVSALGSIHDWSVFKRDEFRTAIPAGINLEHSRHDGQCRFLWSDLNNDGQMQPDEVQFEVGGSGGVVASCPVFPRFIVSRTCSDNKRNEDTPTHETVLYPLRRWRDVVPVFDFQVGRRVIASNVFAPRSTGGDQALFDDWNGRTVMTLGLEPFARESVSGATNGKAMWSYPNPWPGLHASHEAPRPHKPGQLIGITRLLGDFIQVPFGQHTTTIFAMNGNMGNIYLMTSDGLYVAELFHDVRTAPTWSMPIAERDMDVSGLTLHDENFWPSITRTSDGKVHLIDGAHSAIVRVDGLDTLRPIEPFTLTLSEEELAQADAWLVDSELRRQRTIGQPSLRVSLRDDDVVIDGNIDEWVGTDWGIIDRSGVAAHFQSNSQPYDITAAACVSKGRLVVAFQTNLRDLLVNSGEIPEALFKTGGCLDVMIGANPNADPNRRAPVAGDSRLLVTLVDGKPKAMLYRAVVPGTENPVPFSSPWRTITIDRVEDVTEKVEFAAGDRNGIFEIAIPLELVGLSPKSGQKIKADIGVLRGNGFSTLARVYWSNKATAITADVPSEAQLTPSLWGNWMFE